MNVLITIHVNLFGKNYYLIDYPFPEKSYSHISNFRTLTADNCHLVEATFVKLIFLYLNSLPNHG